MSGKEILLLVAFIAWFKLLVDKDDNDDHRKAA
jgi:hypothetical protein